MSIGGLASLVQWFVCVWVGVLVVRMVCWCSGGLFWEDVHRFGECLRVLAPPLREELTLRLVRLWSHAVVVSQQGISLLEGRCVSADVFLWLPRLPITSRPYFWDIFLTPMQDIVRRRSLLMPV